MNEYPELAAFQQIFREILLLESDPQVIRELLLKNRQTAVFKQFIDDMEPRMLATAAELIKKWHV